MNKEQLEELDARGHRMPIDPGEFDELIRLAKLGLSMEDTSKLDPEVIGSDGGLYSLGWYLNWNVGDDNACLDGRFTAAELRAIAAHMDKK